VPRSRARDHHDVPRRTTRATTSPSTRWATTWSRRSRSTRWTTRSCPAFPGRRSRRPWRSPSSTGPGAARSGEPDPNAEHARALKAFWDSWEMPPRRAHRPGRLALDVRAPRRYPPPPPRRRPRHREPVLGPVLRAGPGRTGDPQLAIYSHMINEFIYLYRYPIGTDRVPAGGEAARPDSGKASRRRLPTAGCCGSLDGARDRKPGSGGADAERDGGCAAGARGLSRGGRDCGLPLEHVTSSPDAGRGPTRPQARAALCARRRHRRQCGRARAR